ncbi:hypothetical protein CHUAL_001421 [Chamberlinius hualienensis]
MKKVLCKLKSRICPRVTVNLTGDRSLSKGKWSRNLANRHEKHKADCRRKNQALDFDVLHNSNSPGVFLTFPSAFRAVMLRYVINFI